LRRAMKHYVHPRITFRVECVSVSRKRDVIVITIPASKSKPHYLRVQNQAGYEDALIRVADQTLTASKEMVHLLRHERDKLGVSFEFGDKELFLLRYLEQYGTTTVSEYARIAALSRQQASNTLVTLTRADILHVKPGEHDDAFVLNLEQAKRQGAA